jgi:hypothetical protein
MPWNDVNSTGFLVSDRQCGRAFLDGSLESAILNP